MTPEQLVEKLRHAMPAGLRAIVLYGSAAAGDHLAGKSDYNVLVVADRLGVTELDALAPVSAIWAKAGNRPPVLFTPQRLAMAADSFPIEMLDIQHSRRVLFGEDLLAGIRVAPEYLRLALEREWNAKLLRLRERYLLTRYKPAAVAELMTASLSAYLVLCRAALRLYQAEVPVNKLDAARALAKCIGFDAEVFSTVYELKAGPRNLRDVAPIELFARYLKTIEQIVDAVDQGAHRQP